ncbi:hypothetical protein [Nonomuraea sp. NPDC050202]|jgi:hypothetical protein|uniref:hypothetical protein n=1 Tax=Nonomuraea sp. NPDC050202 TaxID=3155035 RepID=UPI0033F58B95
MQTEQAAPRSGVTAAAPGPVPVADRRRWVWLGIGTALSLLAAQTRYDLAPAAWLFPVFLMRFARTGPARTGLLAGAFDAQGRTLSEHVHERDDRHVVVSEVPVRGFATPYRAIGDVFAWLCVAGTVLLIGLAIHRAAKPQGDG